MTPITKVTPREWMLWPECRKIFDVLNQSGAPQALFVGGCVRNLLLEQPSNDVDIATIHLPADVQRLCMAAGLKTIPTGLDHGTITVLVGEKSFEITTLRRDVATDGRRATVAFSKDWREDAARRDFTMNTLLMDLDGNVYDPLGRGYADLCSRNVVFVGAAEERIREDILRILRFFRFHTLYGNGAPDQDALDACKTLSDYIPELSRERISQEFYKITMHDNAAVTFQLMSDHNVLGDIFERDFFPMERLIQRQIDFKMPHLSARLFVLLDKDLEASEEKYFIFSKQQQNFFRDMRALCKGAKDLPTPKEIIYRTGRDVAGQFFLISYEDEEALSEAVTILQEWDIPKFPVTGADAQNLGVEPGVRMGELLRETEAHWIQEEFKPSKADLIAYLRALLG